MFRKVTSITMKISAVAITSLSENVVYSIVNCYSCDIDNLKTNLETDVSKCFSWPTGKLFVV